MNWSMAVQLAACSRPGALEALRLPVRRRHTGCTAGLEWALRSHSGAWLSVSELRAQLGGRWGARVVNSALRKLWRKGEVVIAEGNPTRYRWASMGKMAEDDPAVALSEVRRFGVAGVMPLKLVIDTDLPRGAWYVVRGPTPEELAYMREAPSDEVDRLVGAGVLTAPRGS